MRWKNRDRSENVEDRRGKGGRVAGKLGIGTIIIVLIAWLMGADPIQTFQQVQQSSSTEQPYVASEEENELAEFVSVVLNDTEDVWEPLFQQSYGTSYKKPTLVLFTGSVTSACGQAAAAMGPFYCSGDDKIYIDLSFCNDLKSKLNAPGDFAVAYVIAHEVGHHIQNQLGISGKVHQMRSQLSEKEYNRLSVKLELQADFLAGLWAHYAQRTKNNLEPGDIDEALNAANAIGDDRLQKQGQGYIVPDAFTHGTSAQRMYWFKKGFNTGDISQGDTFNAPDL